MVHTYKDVPVKNAVLLLQMETHISQIFGRIFEKSFVRSRVLIT